MKSRSRIVLIIVVLITLILGGVAIWIGLRLGQEEDITPDNPLAAPGTGACGAFIAHCINGSCNLTNDINFSYCNYGSDCCTVTQGASCSGSNIYGYVCHSGLSQGICLENGPQYLGPVTLGMTVCASSYASLCAGDNDCWIQVDLDFGGVTTQGTTTIQTGGTTTYSGGTTTIDQGGCPPTQARFRIVDSQDRGWLSSGTYNLANINTFEFAVFKNNTINERFTGYIKLTGPSGELFSRNATGNPRNVPTPWQSGVYHLMAYYTQGGELCDEVAVTFQQNQTTRRTTTRTTARTTAVSTTYETTQNTTANTTQLTTALTTALTTGQTTASSTGETTELTTNLTTELTTLETTQISTAQTTTISTLPETGVHDNQDYRFVIIGLLLLSTGTAFYIFRIGHTVETTLSNILKSRRDK